MQQFYGHCIMQHIDTIPFVQNCIENLKVWKDNLCGHLKQNLMCLIPLWIEYVPYAVYKISEGNSLVSRYHTKACTGVADIKKQMSDYKPI